MTTHDATILANRAAYDRAVSRHALRAARVAIHEAYNEMVQAERSAGATARHYGSMADPRGLGRPASRIVEADEYARQARDRWALLSAQYANARAAALSEEGYDETRDGRTEAEMLAALERERVLLEYPPIGWGEGTGMGKRPRGWTYEERCERWIARSRQDRLSDPRPRDVR